MRSVSDSKKRARWTAEGDVVLSQGWMCEMCQFASRTASKTPWIASSTRKVARCRSKVAN